jgi:chromosome partitioning protein
MPLANHLAIIPAEIDLAGSEVEIARLPNHLTRLREVLHHFRQVGDFEFCLIDCPPSVGILMTNALAASDGVIVPIQCEYFALEGLSKIIHLIEQIRQAVSLSNLRLEGILMTMFDARTRLSQQVVEDVKRYFPEKVFQTIIPRSIRIAEAPSHGKSIFTYDPNGAGAKAYEQLAKEFLRRIDSKEEK